MVRQKPQATTHVINQRRIAYAEVIGNGIHLPRSAFWDLPIPPCVRPLHRHSRHQQGTGKTLRGKLLWVNPISSGPLNKLVYLCTVPITVVSEFRARSCKSAVPPVGEKTGIIVGPDSRQYISFHARDVGEAGPQFQVVRPNRTHKIASSNGNPAPLRIRYAAAIARLAIPLLSIA